MSRITFELLRAAAIIALVLLLTVVGPALDAMPSELDAAQDVALDLKDARIEEWVRVAREANPKLTEHDLSRVRASAMYLEGVR